MWVSSRRCRQRSRSTCQRRQKPSIGFTGTPSASLPVAFRIEAQSVVGQKNGLLYYGYSPALLPFLGGTLCVLPPLRRTPTQNSGGGAPSDCSGVYSWNMNVWIQSGNDPFLVPGTAAQAQYWFRDPTASFGVGLTDAVSFVVGP